MLSLASKRTYKIDGMTMHTFQYRIMQEIAPSKIGNFFRKLFGRDQESRCSEAHCWLPAIKKHKGNSFCAMHYREYTYDVGITRKAL